MSDKIPAHVKAISPTEDNLEVVRKALRNLRDLQKEVEDLQEQIKAKNVQINDITRRHLVDLFNKVGIDNLGLPAEGNLPAYDGRLKPYYRANIAASWPPDKREKAFDYLESIRASDLIKATITISLPRKSAALRKAVLVALRKLKVKYTVERQVPWGTLTAYLRESLEKRRRLLDLETIGAEVGQVVELKQRKQED